jgi:hypothetical protein
MANEELRRKGRQFRDMRRKLDLYEGHSFEHLSKQELGQVAS